MTFFKYISIPLFIFLFTACNSNQPRPKAAPFASKPPKTEAEAKAVRRKQERRKASTKVDVEKLQTPEDTKANAIEILWKIPHEAVDGYIINYGYNEDELELQKTIDTKDLEKFNDPERGLLFKLVLEDIPADKKIYLTVSAFTEDVVSEASEIITVDPQ